MYKVYLFLRSILNIFNINVVKLCNISFGTNPKGGFNFFYYRFYTNDKIVDLKFNLNVESQFTEVLNFLDSGQIVLCHVDIKSLRQCWYFYLESSPLTLATNYVLNLNYDSFYKSIVKDYNFNYPLKASDRVFISDRTHYLYNFSPIACPLPWEKKTISKLTSSRKKGYLIENNRMGLDNCKEGLIFGPLSESKIVAEYTRINNLLQSLKNTGYLRNSSEDGDIGGLLLIDDSVKTDLKFCVRLDTKGNHRASALVSLGYKSIPIRIYPENVIRLSELKSWHYVINSVFTKDEAEKVFFSILNPHTN